jgi:hypothetical protein
VYLAMPPLFRIDAGKETHWALDEKERDRVLAKLAKNVKPEISRFKGLGEMPAEELKATTLDPKRRRALRVAIQNELLTDQVLNDLMGKDAQARYRFIMEQAEKADAEALDVLPMGTPRRLARAPSTLGGAAARVHELLSAAGCADPYLESLKLVVAAVVTPDGAVEERLRRAREELSEVADVLSGSEAPEAVAKECLALFGMALSGKSDLGLIDAAFAEMTSRRGRADKGQFFTPRQLVEMAVRLVLPADGEVVLDPACGSGAFLWHAAMRAPCAVHGIDVDGRAAAAARVLLALARRRKAPGPTAVVQIGDGLSAKLPRADVVLSNPPFAGEIIDAEVLSAFELGRGRARIARDWLFLERAISALRPGGRMAIVLPQGTVGGTAAAPARELLLRTCRVTAVIGLDPSMFMPHTQQRTCLVIATRREADVERPPPGETILMVVSHRSGHDRRGVPLPSGDGQTGTDAWSTLDHDLGELLSEMETGSGKSIRRITVEELGTDLSLSPQRFFTGTGASGTRLGDVVALGTAAVSAGHRGYLVDTGDVEQGLVRGDVARRGETEAGSAKRLLFPGDVIVSRLRPYLRQIGLIDRGLPSPLLGSTELLALRPKEPEDDIAFLAVWLLGDHVQASLAAAVEGGHHPRFSKEILLDLMIPESVLRRRASLSSDLRHAIELRRAAESAMWAALDGSG